jgi:Fe-S cluster assembly protein SufD
MTVVLVKTPAETALSADFKARGAELPGGGAVAAARAAAMAAFEKQGLPHRRVEAWKYTDLRNVLAKLAPIATHDDAAVSLADVNAALGPLSALDADRVVFVNGSYRAELSTAKPRKQLRSEAMKPLSPSTPPSSPTAQALKSRPIPSSISP